MAEFVWGGYRLEVDVEATGAYYDSHPGPWITCTCGGCRNFMLAVKMLPQAVRDYFHTLGLDPEKPGELCYYQGTAQRLSGGGWYHLAGRILSGDTEPGAKVLFPAGWYELDEHCSVGFKSECDLLEEDFPRPCFQMEFNHDLPWLLNKKNPYQYD